MHVPGDEAVLRVYQRNSTLGIVPNLERFSQRIVTRVTIMATTLRTSVARYWLWYIIALGGLALLIGAPGGFAEKSRTLLHGLCAQTPSHSFSFGSQLLPFDARMTGIYSGVLVTLAYLAFQGRLLAWGLPPVRMMVVLALFIVAMAADGFNSLFTDLGLWHPWAPGNEARLVTGYLTGVTLAVVLAWLLGSAVYRVGRRQAGVKGASDLALVIIPLAPLAMLLFSGAPWLYLPMSMLLVVSAWLTMSMLALAVVVLAFRLDERVEQVQGLHVPGAFAAIAGLGIMLILAFGRMWLESTLGIPSTL